MSDNLKPCPFCGWDAPYVRTTGVETEVYCQNCTAVGPMVHSVSPDEDVDEVAIKLWNHRADAATIKAAAEMMANEHGWVSRERLEKDVNRIEGLERERDEWKSRYEHHNHERLETLNLNAMQASKIGSLMNKIANLEMEIKDLRGKE